MNVIEEIEKELKRISPWPWDWSSLCLDTPRKGIVYSSGLSNFSGQWVLGAWNATLRWVCQMSGGVYLREEDASFIAKSPERIAALVEYVKAAETLINRAQVVPLQATGERIIDWQTFKAARKGLGLTED